MTEKKPERKPSLVRKIESTKAMQKCMMDYFGELFNAAKTGSTKIAWCTTNKLSREFPHFTEVHYIIQA